MEPWTQTHIEPSLKCIHVMIVVLIDLCIHQNMDDGPQLHEYEE